MRMCAYYAHAHYAFVPAALRQDAFVHARILISGGGGSCRRQRKSAAPTVGLGVCMLVGSGWGEEC